MKRGALTEVKHLKYEHSNIEKSQYRELQKWLLLVRRGQELTCVLNNKMELHKFRKAQLAYIQRK